MLLATSLPIRSLVWTLILIAVAGAADGAPRPDRDRRDADVVLSSATRLRALALEAPRLIERDLDRMPEGVFDRTEAALKARGRVWSSFFAGTLLKARGLKGDRPEILFLNPFADVAVLQRCRRDASGALTCDELCAMPGERLAGDAGRRLTRVPPWLQVNASVEELATIARRRLATFAETRSSGAADSRPPCSSQDQRAAEIRLVDLGEAISRVNRRSLAESLRCAAGRRPECTAEPVSDPRQRERVAGLVRSAENLAVAGVIHSRGQVRLLVVPKTSAWEIAVINVKAEANEHYAFQQLSWLAF